MKMRVASGGIRTHDTLYSRQMHVVIVFDKLISVIWHGVGPKSFLFRTSFGPVIQVIMSILSLTALTHC